MDVLCHLASIQSFRIYCVRRERERERETENFSVRSASSASCSVPLLLAPVRAILSEVGEFEKSFLMFLPTGFQPINNVCCWQVGNLKGEMEKWYREERG
jgi:hypothetical protein